MFVVTQMLSEMRAFVFHIHFHEGMGFVAQVLKRMSLECASCAHAHTCTCGHTCAGVHACKDMQHHANHTLTQDLKEALSKSQNFHHKSCKAHVKLYESPT